MPLMKDFICDKFNSLSYTWGHSKVINSFSRLQGNVLPPWAIPSLFSHVQCIDSSSTHFWHRGQQSLLLRKYHPSSERNSFSHYSCRKQSYGLVLNSDQHKPCQISRESPNIQVPHVVSCPTGSWLIKEQTSLLLRQVSFPLVHNSSTISRIRGPKLKYLLIIYQTGI